MLRSHRLQGARVTWERRRKGVGTTEALKIELKWHLGLVLAPLLIHFLRATWQEQILGNNLNEDGEGWLGGPELGGCSVPWE